MALQARDMPMMYSKEAIVAAAREKGHTEEEIERILAKVDDLKRHGLVKTSGQGTNVGLTVAGRKKLVDRRAQGKILSR